MRRNTTLMNDLRERFYLLAEHHQVVALKTGTEVEDMDMDEIALMREIAPKSPLTVKIGGPEARRDMRECLAVGVDVLLAPMVESVYSLINFVETAETIMCETNKNVRLAMNLETALAIHNLDAMIASKAFVSLSQVTIGRGDLSKSMNLRVDDEEVLSLTRNVLIKLARQNKLTSVGGGLSVQNISVMAEVLPASRFNTRHVVFNNSEEFAQNAAVNLS
ncbi:MAG TPA: aldolase/citrate lyase family protein, partial [Turneriella sp.]|nr:aldolase/citrate lyase family protein [Turneriella sp.]